MSLEHDHKQAVANWLAAIGRDDDPQGMIDSFFVAFNSIWRRAIRTLGEVTLTAIADRALHFATERYPYFNSLVLEPDGIRCDQLRVKAAGLPPQELKAALGLVLFEFLSLLGNLTAEILTPALHAELSVAASPTQDPLPVNPQGPGKKEGTE